MIKNAMSESENDAEWVASSQLIRVENEKDWGGRARGCDGKA